MRHDKITPYPIPNFATLPKGFSDVEMVIPGGLIRESLSHIEFRGDHIACAYWFYQ